MSLDSPSMSIFFSSNDFEESKNLLERLCNHIKTEQDYFEKHIDSIVSSAKSDEEKDWIYETYSEDHYLLSNKYPKFILDSFFLKIYSQFEHTLLKTSQSIYDKHSKTRHVKIEITDFHGQGIKRYKNYLEKVWNIRLSKLDSQRFTDINTIRNCIAHNDGLLKENTKVSSKEENDILDKYSHITINQEYVNSVINFFLDCYTETNEQIKQNSLV
jgi:hypothetical protein